MTTQLELESAVRHHRTPTPRFEGADYDHKRDSARLTGQKERIFAVVKDGQWRTIQEIAKLTNAPENSLSSQLRQLRMPKFGGHQVNRKYMGDGLYLYQLEVSK